MPPAKKLKTQADIEKAIEKAKAQLAALEQQKYGTGLDEAVAGYNFATIFDDIKKKVAGAKDIVILNAIGKAAGIKRLSITQTEPAARAPRTPESIAQQKATAAANKANKAKKAEK